MVRAQWTNLARMPRSHLFNFNDHRESGPWFNISSEGYAFFVLFLDSIISPSLYWGATTNTDHRVSTRCWSH